MIKCIHEECCWPECEKTCGLVPAEENYPVGASLEEGLIYHLQGRISELKTQLKNYQDQIRMARLEILTADKKLKSFIVSEWDNYPRACKYGYEDCVYDPGYLRKHDLDWWKELGMPITCEHCKDGSGYDDEDK